MTRAVYLHVGEPKTGTTFLQQVMQGNRAALLEHGVSLPGITQNTVFRATQDLRGAPRRADDPAPPWDGQWERIVAEARGADGVSVISHELFSATTPEQVARAVASFDGVELHVVISVRDMATLLPAEWQESIKHRNTRRWDDWLGDVVDVESSDPQRRRFWFWHVHDTAAILAMWEAAGVPRERLHVLTMPRSGSEPGLLWHRFAGLIGVAPDAADIGRARRNASLGRPETELLRRFNATMDPELPNWYYTRHVKEGLAHGALARRSGAGRLTLPAARLPWAIEYGRSLAAQLVEAGYPVVGDLEELVPSAAVAPRAQTPGAPPDAVGVPGDDEIFDAAMDATVALLQRRHRQLVKRASPLTTRKVAAVLAHATTRTLPGMDRVGRAAGRARVSVTRRVEGRRADR